ncbi:MAG: tetratricopeptide repeat protein [Pseudomonadota bacterium]
MSNTAESGWSHAASQLWDAGERNAAINTSLALWQQQKTVVLALQNAYFMFLLNDYKTAAFVLDQQLQHDPEHLDLHTNLAVCCSRMGEPARALHHAQQASRLNPTALTPWDTQAQTLHVLGDEAGAVAAGSESLRLKDLMVSKMVSERGIAAIEPPAHSAAELADGKKRIISFALWGSNPRYLRGALRNALLVGDIYPGWVCRFHVDASVPDEFLNILRQLGAEISLQPGNSSLLARLSWRFLVASDPEVGYFMVRDCDSVISLREARAVQDWLDSGAYFHVMRDWWSHTDLMLAGLWGGVAGILPSMGELLAGYRTQSLTTPNIDQWFLRDEIWPRIRAHCRVHDRCFQFGNPVAFPGPPATASHHVGQDEFAAHRAGQARLLDAWIARLPCLAL